MTTHSEFVAVPTITAVQAAAKQRNPSSCSTLVHIFTNQKLGVAISVKLDYARGSDGGESGTETPGKSKQAFDAIKDDGIAHKSGTDGVRCGVVNAIERDVGSLELRN